MTDPVRDIEIEIEIREPRKCPVRCASVCFLPRDRPRYCPSPYHLPTWCPLRSGARLVFTARLEK